MRSVITLVIGILLARRARVACAQTSACGASASASRGKGCVQAKPRKRETGASRDQAGDAKASRRCRRPTVQPDAQARRRRAEVRAARSIRIAGEPAERLRMRGEESSARQGWTCRSARCGWTESCKSPNGMIAVVANPQQRTYFLREGDQLYDGRVEKIAMDGVSFHEVGQGCVRQASGTASKQENLLQCRRTAMKTNWPAFRNGCLILASVVLGASPCSRRRRSPPARPRRLR